MDALEQNRIYKEQKKLETIQRNKTLSLVKMKRKRSDYRSEKSREAQRKIRVVYFNRERKDVESRTKKHNEKRDKEIKNQERKIKGHKIVEYKEKPKSRTKEFWKLLVLIQKRRRVYDADENWYCVCYTCWAIRHRKSINWWHWCSRTKKSIAWHEDWIRCQCSSCNSPFNWWLAWNYPVYEAVYDKERGEGKYKEKIQAWNKPIDTLKYWLPRVLDRQDYYKWEIKRIMEEKGL